MNVDPNTTLAIVALVASALLIDMAMPQRGTRRTWDNKRAAPQRDVADVLRGRGPAQGGPRALPLVALLVVVFGIAVVFGR